MEPISVSEMSPVPNLLYTATFTISKTLKSSGDNNCFARTEVAEVVKVVEIGEEVLVAAVEVGANGMMKQCVIIYYQVKKFNFFSLFV